MCKETKQQPQSKRISYLSITAFRPRTGSLGPRWLGTPDFWPYLEVRTQKGGDGHSMKRKQIPGRSQLPESPPELHKENGRVFKTWGWACIQTAVLLKICCFSFKPD
jgi:hypothetical protein